jgi:hypothetical protein
MPRGDDFQQGRDHWPGVNSVKRLTRTLVGAEDYAWHLMI